jgi:hypothetical protein
MGLSLQQTRPTAVFMVPSAPVAAQLHNATARLNQQSLAFKRKRDGTTAAAAAAITSTELAAVVEPELASACWGMPYAPTRIHMVHGTPASIAEIVPLQLEDLRPANLTSLPCWSSCSHL